MLTMSVQLDTNLQVFFGPFWMSKSTGSDVFCCALICWVELFSFFWYQVEEAILFISVPQNSFWVNVFLLFAIATRRMLCCQIKSMIWKNCCIWSKNAKLNNKVSNNPESSQKLYWKYFSALIPAPNKIFCFINLHKNAIFDKMCLLLIQPLKVNMSTIISIFLSEFCTDLAMRYSDYPNQTN